VKHIPAVTALSVLLSLFSLACDEHVPSSLVDAGVDAGPVEAGPDTSPPDAESPDSAMADACVTSADAQSCTGQLCGFVPPPFHPLAIQACASPQIDAYVMACGYTGYDFTPACLAWKADPANATCKSCVLRTDHSGPILFYSDGTTATPNEGACVALKGAPACGAADDANYSCLLAACGSCPADGGTLTGNCYETAGSGTGACAAYGNTLDTCLSTLTGPAAACEVNTDPWTAPMRLAISVLCGIPDDGGSSDSGLDGESDASTQEGGASEAGPGDGASD
jgi:hypothetical protein